MRKIKEHKEAKPVWPNAVQSNTEAGASRLLTWVFNTWNNHADADDISLKNQYLRRAQVLHNVEIAIKQHPLSEKQKLEYRQRLLRDMHQNADE